MHQKGHVHLFIINNLLKIVKDKFVLNALVSSRVEGYVPSTDGSLNTTYSLADCTTYSPARLGSMRLERLLAKQSLRQEFRGTASHGLLFDWFLIEKLAPAIFFEPLVPQLLILPYWTVLTIKHILKHRRDSCIITLISKRGLLPCVMELRHSAPKGSSTPVDSSHAPLERAVSPAVYTEGAHVALGLLQMKYFDFNTKGVI